MTSHPLYMSEDEEDIRWQLERNLIDPQLAETLLKELEFENSEVQFDEDHTIENFHYI